VEHAACSASPALVGFRLARTAACVTRSKVELAWMRSGARFQEPALGYRYPISCALANASVRFLAPSLTMADDR
jgi:hypothetical protein